MIKVEYLENNLVRHSHDTHKIIQVETGIEYDEAVDVMPCVYTYQKSNNEKELEQKDE